MGDRGPQPKPTALRELEGNPGKQPINKREPKPNKIIEISPPDWLSLEAKRYWQRMVPILSNMGVLTEADLPLLERYCDFLADWRECRDFLRQKGQIWYPIFDGDKVDPLTGNRVIKYLAEFPHVAKKLRFSEHLLKIEMHFGMTPAARSRIMTEDLLDLQSSGGVSSREEKDIFDPDDIN